jgi:hypothetical protein
MSSSQILLGVLDSCNPFLKRASGTVLIYIRGKNGKTEKPQLGKLWYFLCGRSD